MAGDRPSDEEPDDAGLLRPYVLTGGRTQADVSDVSIETIVMTIEGRAEGHLSVEGRQIVDICVEPTSVGELAAELGIPVGVASVLVSDLVTEGVLRASRKADASDGDLIERLIGGIESL